ncbi:MAG: DUF86 domain-containing protein [Firmicutes bacterium]|nr:DUF86 domain-containing protein [Bacillota bacterium]
MTVDLDKVRQKLQYIRSQVRDLQWFLDMEEDRFSRNTYYVAAATRMLQIAIEAMLDLCAHIIAREGWGLPKSYREIVLVAAEHGLIPAELRDRYVEMTRFRNCVVHLYDDVEGAEVLRFIKEHLSDFRPLVATVVRRYLGGEPLDHNPGS